MCIEYRHPDKEERPNFEGIMLVLLMQDRLILSIPEEDLSTHPLAGTIGAPLEAGEKCMKNFKWPIKLMIKLNDLQLTSKDTNAQALLHIIELFFFLFIKMFL